MINIPKNLEEILEYRKKKSYFKSESKFKIFLKTIILLDS